MSLNLFRVKICGITSAQDAAVAAEAGADAIGLNFFPKSPRYVTPEQASEIARDLPSGVLRVGVFVNAATPEVLRTVQCAGLDAVQIHGDEPPSMLRELAAVPTIRAFRCSLEQVPNCLRYLDECHAIGRMPDAVLIDALQIGQYGGTGHRADHGILEKIRKKYLKTHLVLAGGLNPDNVEEAIRSEVPDGVDTASGVEASPGVKSPQKVAAFVANARNAFRHADLRR